MKNAISVSMGLLLIGCAAINELMHDRQAKQVVQIPTLIRAVKDNILIAAQCMQIDGKPPLLALGGVKLRFNTVVAQTSGADGKPILGVVPLSVTANIKEEQTQEITLDLLPIQVGPGAVEATYVDEKGLDGKTAGRDYPTSWKSGDYVMLGSKTYFVGRDNKNEEYWIDAGQVKSLKAAGVPPLDKATLADLCSPPR